jgi:hypothetical protein
LPKKLPFLVALGLLACAFAVIDPAIEAITATLEKFRQHYPQEKIHLHTDKPFYSIGDTICYKAYLVNAENNRPSAISHILYVDLINEQQQVQQTMLLPVENGITWGSITLSDSLQEGHYQLRAYTNWMRNFDDAYFFTKDLPVGNAFIGKTATQMATGSQRINSTAAGIEPAVRYSLQFFPEGGQMINELPTRLGFKALTENGLGIPVTGKIVNEQGNQAASFNAAFAGIGSVVFTPSSGHTYYAMVQYADGTQNKIPLPSAATAGYVLSADNMDGDKVVVKLFAKGVSSKNVILAVQSNHRMVTAQKLALVNGTATITLQKEQLPAGIVQLTLFDEVLKPVAERLVFIDHDEHLQIDVTPDKQTYHSHEPIKMTVDVKDEVEDPVAGSFSVAVTNANAITGNNTQTITSNLLLTSDLRGYIENPAYYFTAIDEQKIRALDNLLLTQGWRRFTWASILAGNYPATPFAAEQGLALQGKVTNTAGEPVAQARVTLITKKGSGYIADTTTDSEGGFTFDRLYFADSMPVAVQAVGPNGSKEVVVTLHQFTSPAISLATSSSITHDRSDSALLNYIAQSKPWFEELRKKGVIDNKGTLLKAVTVKAKQLTKVQEALEPSSNLNGPGRADHVLTYLDIPNCSDLTVCLPGKLAGVFFRPMIINGQVTSVPYSSLGMGKAMLVIVDGMDMSSTDGMFSLKSIPGSDVQSVEVLRPGMYASAYGFRGVNGVLVITTKRGGLDYYGLDAARKKNSTPPKGVAFATIKGYAANREFYVPAYSPATVDLRSTIYWQPNMLTNEEGKTTLELPNGAPPGRYQVMIEGISGDGKMGTTIFTYEVIK